MAAEKLKKRPKRVLIADDDPIFAKASQHMLSEAGFDVVEAQNGVEAYRKLQSCEIDLAVVDISMPRLDGFRLISLMRSTLQWRHLPVMVVTSRTDQQAYDEAYKVGTDDFLTKPIHWEQFPERVT